MEKGMWQPRIWQGVCCQPREPGLTLVAPSTHLVAQSSGSHLKLVTIPRARLVTRSSGQSHCLLRSRKLAEPTPRDGQPRLAFQRAETRDPICKKSDYSNLIPSRIMQ